MEKLILIDRHFYLAVSCASLIIPCVWHQHNVYSWLFIYLFECGWSWWEHVPSTRCVLTIVTYNMS